MIMEWQHYLLGTILILLLYYSALCLWHFYQKFKKLPREFSKPADIPEKRAAMPFEETSEVVFKQLEDLTEALKQAITLAFQKKYNRSKLLNSLASVLRRYPSLHHFPYQAAIHQLIASECEKYGPVGLREDELKDLWDNEPD